MKIHDLKILSIYFVDVKNGYKTFELRKNDRDYHVDDLIIFTIVDEKGRLIQDDEIYQITYVLKNVPQYGLDKDYCILGIRKTGGRLFR